MIALWLTSMRRFARGRQWYHPRPNHRFSPFERSCFRYIPFWQRYYRLKTFLDTDSLAASYGSSPEEVKRRKEIEENAKEYIYSQAPQEYHDVLVSEFALGCKRRIFDPNYLSSLHLEHVDLVAEGIRQITKTGIISESGYEEDFDIIILATGFQVSDFLTPMKIVGKTGVPIKDQWESDKGAQAYLGHLSTISPTSASSLDQIPSLRSILSSTLWRCKLTTWPRHSSRQSLIAMRMSLRSGRKPRRDSSRILTRHSRRRCSIPIVITGT